MKIQYATLNVEGMSCQNCVKAIERALLEEVGVQSVQVQLESGRVIVDYDDDQVAIEDIELAIEQQGFDVVD